MNRKILNSLLRKVGYEVAKVGTHNGLAPDMEPEFSVIYQTCREYTMTSAERMYALYKAIDYVVRKPIPGDIVECGVWKGGSAMVAALALKSAGASDRRLWLYDTFTGMSEPTEHDVRTSSGTSAAAKWKKSQRGAVNEWCLAPRDEVEANLAKTGYPPDRLTFVQGKVEDTIPAQAPEKIALLRLDTDWYESTRHELVHLFPRISPGGILIVDDYGIWAGSKKAVDEYLKEKKLNLLLDRVDLDGRVARVD